MNGCSSMSENNQINTEKAYQAALLADAAYINFKKGKDYWGSTGIIKPSINSKETADKFIEDRGFTQEQFEAFRKRYRIHHFQGNTDTGFAGTVFKDTENDDQLIVAMRGTEGLVDILGQDGALATGVSLIVGQLLQTGKINDFLKKAGILDDEGNTVAEYHGKIKFVGHSLGGHLALVANYRYPELQDETYTFNGAGISRLFSFVTPDRLIINIRELTRKLLDSPTLNESKVYNIYSEPGLEVTANKITFVKPSDYLPTFIEKQGGSDITSDISFDNHSMVNLVNSLSVQRIFAYLDAENSYGEINSYLNLVSNKVVELRNQDGTPIADTENAGESLSIAMHHLAQFLGEKYIALATQENASGVAEYNPALFLNKADEFYKQLVSDFGKTPPFTVKPMYKLNDNVEQLIADFGEEAVGKATRYSLMNLSPFVVIPKNADYTRFRSF